MICLMPTIGGNWNFQLVDVLWDFLIGKIVHVVFGIGHSFISIILYKFYTKKCVVKYLMRSLATYSMVYLLDMLRFLADNIYIHRPFGVSTQCFIFGSKVYLKTKYCMQIAHNPTVNRCSMYQGLGDQFDYNDLLFQCQPQIVSGIFAV